MSSFFFFFQFAQFNFKLKAFRNTFIHTHIYTSTLTLLLLRLRLRTAAALILAVYLCVYSYSYTNLCACVFHFAISPLLSPIFVRCESSVTYTLQISAQAQFILLAFSVVLVAVVDFHTLAPCCAQHPLFAPAPLAVVAIVVVIFSLLHFVFCMRSLSFPRPASIEHRFTG